MPYSSNIPQAADLLNASQRDLLDNFLELKTAIDVNHGTFGAADQGKHKWVSIPANPQPGAPASGANELILLDTISRFTQRPELGFRAGGTNTIATMSAATQAPINFFSGWAPISPGIVLKWGQAEGNGAHIVNFPVGLAVPAFTAGPFHITLCPVMNDPRDSNISVQILNIINADSFQVACQYRTIIGFRDVRFFYLAIGAV